MSDIPTCIIGSSHITAPLATGGHDPDKYAEVGSFTKVITGTILEQLAGQGVLTVDDPVERWLDVPAGSGITLRHLAEHTSGLPRVPPGTTNINPYKKFSDDRLRVLLTAGLDRLTAAPAGEREEYSNFGYSVLGATLTAASGQEYSDLVATHVLSPLGLPPEAMTAHPPEHSRTLASGWFGRSVKPWDMTGAILPAGGLWATPRTVARVLTGLVLDRTLGEPALSWQRTGPLPLMWHNGGTRKSTIFAGAIPDGRWIVVHRLHGSQLVTDPAGRLLWISPALPGRTHDLTAARTHRIIRICERQGIPILADRAYMGAGPWVTTPHRRPPGRGLTPTQQTVNRALSAARAPVERGVARLKSWRILRKARCSPNRMSSITAALLTLERQR